MENPHGKWVCLKIVYPYTQWFMIIIPIKWLELGIYPIFRQTQMIENGGPACSESPHFFGAKG